MTDHFGHLMAHIFTLWDLARERCSYSLQAGLCLLRAASFYWAIVSLALGGGAWGGGVGGRAGAVREFARSSRAVGATRRGTEGALSHISEEEEQENDGTEES